MQIYDWTRRCLSTSYNYTHLLSITTSKQNIWSHPRCQLQLTHWQHSSQSIQNYTNTQSPLVNQVGQMQGNIALNIPSLHHMVTYCTHNKLHEKHSITSHNWMHTWHQHPTFARRNKHITTTRTARYTLKTLSYKAYTTQTKKETPFKQPHIHPKHQNTAKCHTCTYQTKMDGHYCRHYITEYQED